MCRGIVEVISRTVNVNFPYHLTYAFLHHSS